MEQTVLLILEILMGVIIALIAFIIKDMKKKISELDSEIKSMKDNYLSRFERVIQNQNANHLEIKEVLSGLKTDIALLQQTKQHRRSKNGNY
jgi:predicted PurR-regulated permease PerM